MATEAKTLDPCDLCGKVQTVNGAVLWGPPNGARMSLKDHVCVACYQRVKRPPHPPKGSACDTCLGARVLCYHNMKAVPCRAWSESACPNTGHHTCPECY